jgi:hypothetical protein
MDQYINEQHLLPNQSQLNAQNILLDLCKNNKIVTLQYLGKYYVDNNPLIKYLWDYRNLKGNEETYSDEESSETNYQSIENDEISKSIKNNDDYTYTQNEKKCLTKNGLLKRCQQSKLVDLIETKRGRPKKILGGVLNLVEDEQVKGPNDKIVCEICKGSYTRSNSGHHKKTKLHQKMLQMNNKLRELLDY